MRFNQLPNDGYISDILSKDLFDNLLKEVLECEHTEPTFFTDIDTEGTTSKYKVSEKNINDLSAFLNSYIKEYDREYGYLKTIKVLTENGTLVFQQPWYNVQQPHNYLPCHYHDGIISYTIWLQLPSKSKFTFVYNTVTGKTNTYDINLTSNNVGEFIIFPSTLNHVVYQYPSDNLNKSRISLSGNILLEG